ncbi:pirin-like protein-like [Dorcoceras hygrometricum]|uniref:Pirin-like protein-like n=1 Tax=Dorcoceras hygrometricum TaxID=472368 RepID=A0A2Z7AKI7_9LAMI|nr:pirin-like protein-like [Dorcoceras hygrometricum]
MIFGDSDLARAAASYDDVSGATSFKLVATPRFDVAAGISRRKCFTLFCVLLLNDQQLAFTRVFGIPSSVIVLSIRYGFELVLRRGYGLDEFRGSLIVENASTIAPAGFVGGNVLLLVAAAFTRVFGISSSVIVLSIRYGFELVLRRGYGLDELLRGRAVIPHSHLPAGIVATMRRVVNYHSSWARQQQVELFDASGNPGSTAGRGFNPAGGAPGGG